jgi:hypothetical protein
VFERWMRGALGVSTTALPRAESLTRSRRLSSSPQDTHMVISARRDNGTNYLITKAHCSIQFSTICSNSIHLGLCACLFLGNMVALAVPGPHCPCISLRRDFCLHCAFSPFGIHEDSMWIGQMIFPCSHTALLRDSLGARQLLQSLLRMLRPHLAIVIGH